MHAMMLINTTKPSVCLAYFEAQSHVSLEKWKSIAQNLHSAVTSAFARMNYDDIFRKKGKVKRKTA
jgi:hypothetical protein